MNTVFVGGSRHISKLPPQVEERLENLISTNLNIVVGDANGADKAVQKFFAAHDYDHVTVYCSGETCRNNIGNWKTQNIAPSDSAKGFQYYAAKDREMAKEADFGLMLWDGKSPGTILNVLRLVRTGKKAVLYDIAKKKVSNFKSPDDWKAFISSADKDIVESIRERATPSEWTLNEDPHQPSLLDHVKNHRKAHEPREVDETGLIDVINNAIETGNPSSVIDVLGNIAREQGMTQLAKESGLARESLYRALSVSGNPEFATVFRVLTSLGLRLKVYRAAKASRSPRQELGKLRGKHR
jgi:probable addiction module antidote protein